MPALERLLERPQAVGAGHHLAAGVHYQQLRQVQAELAERGGRQRLRRIEQHDQPAAALHRGQAGD
jgi:hypothetical protein